MKAYFDYSANDQNFWDTYAILWESSLYQSAFQAPHFIQYLTSQAKNTLLTFKFQIGDELSGVAFFHKHGGEYSFLSDMKSDHNFFIIHKKCSPGEIEFFFNAFINNIEKENLAFRLNSQPEWASYSDTFKKARNASHLFWTQAKYTYCLTLDEPTPEALFQRTNRQKLRQKLNGLKELDTVSLEAYTGDEDWESWMKDFFQSHISRWENTPTPSAYRSLQKQEFIDKCLKAWLKNGLLARFSIKLGDKRIAFVVGVIEKNSLIHHSTSHDDTYFKYSPGLVLIRLIGKWMEENNFTKLDFGDGNEAYKYLFAKKEDEHELNTIFISSPKNIPFVLKARLISSVKGSPKLQKFYADKLKPIARKLSKNIE